MMSYSFGHPMQLCCTLLYSHVRSRSNFSTTFLCRLGQGKSFLQTLSVVFLQSSPVAVLFLLFLAYARSLVLQSFKMDSGEESEVEVSSEDGENAGKYF